MVWASIGQSERITAYFLFTKRSRQEGTPTLTLSAALLLVARVAILPVALLGGGRLAPQPVELGLLALLALVPGHGHLLVNWAHQRVSATLASLLLSSVPVLAALWAYLILGEAFGRRPSSGWCSCWLRARAGVASSGAPGCARQHADQGSGSMARRGGPRASILAMAASRVQLFGLAKSKPTRKAQRFFSERRIDVHFVDCAQRPPSAGELARFVQRFGAEALLDPTSKAYRDQGLQYVSASEESWIERMSRDPSILALPLGRLGQELTVGDDPEGWQRLADAARA